MNEKEEGAVVRFQKGDFAAAADFIECNEGMIQFVYRKYFNGQDNFKEDFFQEGRLGLMEAISRFTPAKRGGFKTFKFLWVRKKMMEFGKKNQAFHARAQELISDFEKEPSRSEKLMSALFELDNCVSSGKMERSEAKSLVKKILKGKK